MPYKRLYACAIYVSCAQFHDPDQPNLVTVTYPPTMGIKMMTLLETMQVICGYRNLPHAFLFKDIDVLLIVQKRE